MTVYLDHNATTPPHPDVLAAMHEVAARAWANPSSVHRAGQQARAELDACRHAVAALVRLHPRDVVLTSGGTEANNLALRHLFADAPSGTLVVSRLEHPSIATTAEALAREGVEVRWVAPKPEGLIAPEAVAEALEGAPGPRLVSVAAVNHETGVIQPVAAIAALAQDATLHVDAVQAAGRLPAESWGGADLLTVAAHKIRGPKGIGALVTRPGLKLRPVLLGGEQERGLRPGTQGAGLAAGFRVAAERAVDGPARYAALAPLRDRLEAELLGARFGKSALVNGTGPRAPHVSNLSWPGWASAELCAALDLEGVMASSGSACSAGTAEPSKVITAMLGAARAASAVRLSLGETTTPEDVDAALAAFERVLARTGPVS